MARQWTNDDKAKACAEVIARVRDGKSLSKACIGDDWLPPRKTFEDWCDADPILAAEYARAREARAEAIFEECLEISDRQGADVVTIDGVDTVDHNVIARNRLMIDTRRWMLGKMQPKKYGDKIAIGGADDLPPIQAIDAAKLSTDTLREILAVTNANPETDE
jgi:hypothetical protein